MGEVKVSNNKSGVISMKQVKKAIREGQEAIGKSCDERKSEMIQFKIILENEI